MNNPTPPTPLEVQYPNGGVLGVQMYVYDTATASPILWTGAAFTGSVTVGAISGSKGNDTVVPGTTNLGVLPAVVVGTAGTTYTLGNQALLTVTEDGFLNVNASVSIPGALTVSGTVSIANTTFNVGNAITISSIPAVNVTVSNTTFTVANTARLVTVANTTFNVGNSVTVSGSVSVATTIINVTVSNTTFTVANTAFAINNAVNTTVSNTNRSVTGNVNATISNTTFTLANTTVTVANTVSIVTATVSSIGGVAYSNGAVSSTTFRTINAALTAHTTASLTGNTATVSTVGVVLGNYMIYNPNATVEYVQLFNVNAVAATATNPNYVISIPAASAANLAQMQLNFTTALIIKAATSFAGTVAPTTGLNISLGYSVI